MGQLHGRLPTDGINYVRITLDPSDTYTVRFARTRGLACTEIASVDDVYCDTLTGVFTHHTGLDTSL